VARLYKEERDGKFERDLTCLKIEVA